MKRSPDNVRNMQFPRGLGVSFDPLAFDEAVWSQGVTLIHWRSMRCPVGLVDRYDIRRPHDDHSGCSNGFLYTKAGPVTAVFTGNSNQNQQTDLGLIDGASAMVTFSTTYDETDERVQITQYDRLYLSEESITVPHWQLVEAHITGVDKLSFPVVTVTDLVDSSGKRYTQNDFTVKNGQVHWVSGNRPGPGAVYSIRYTYRPYFYIKHLPHEVRVSQAPDPISGERVTTRMPQAALIVREFIYEKEDADDQAPDPDSTRQVKGPAVGSFGPR